MIPEVRWVAEMSSRLADALPAAPAPRMDGTAVPSAIGACARKAGFVMSCTPRDTGAQTPAERYSSFANRALRAAALDVIAGAYPDVETRPSPRTATFGQAHGRIAVTAAPDVVHRDAAGQLTLWNVSVMHRYAFQRRTVGEARWGQITAPEGPSDEDTRRIAAAGAVWAAHGFNVVGLRVIYLTRDPLDARSMDTPYVPSGAASRAVSADYYMPFADVVDDISNELDRLSGVALRLRRGEMPRPVIPGFGRVAAFDPFGNGINDGGETDWSCKYCGWREQCASIGLEQEGE